MYLEGNWSLMSIMENNKELEGKWDVAVLPMCPDPINGDGRATISNGLCYATGAKGKNLEIVKDVLKFLGSEEGQRIQGESGAAIPAYEGLEDTWIGVFDQFEGKPDVQKCVDMFDYGIQSVNNAYRSVWKTKVTDELLRIYSGKVTLDEGLDNIQNSINTASEE